MFVYVCDEGKSNFLMQRNGNGVSPLKKVKGTLEQWEESYLASKTHNMKKAGLNDQAGWNRG